MRRGSLSRERKKTPPADRRGHIDLQNPSGAVRQDSYLSIFCVHSPAFEDDITIFVFMA